MVSQNLLNGDTQSGEVIQPDFQVISSIRSDIHLRRCSKNTAFSGHTRQEPSQFYMLQLHYDRIVEALRELGWDEAYRALANETGLLDLQQALISHLFNRYGDAEYPAPLKIRILVDPHGAMKVDSTQVPSLPFIPSSFTHFPPILSQLPPPLDHPLSKPTWRVYVSPIAVQPSIFTRHKTTERSIYDMARSLLPNVPIASTGDVLAEILIVNQDNQIMEGSIATPYFWRGEQWVTPAASSGGNLGTTRRYALMSGLCEEAPILKDSLSIGEAIWLSNGARGWGWGRVEEILQ